MIAVALYLSTTFTFGAVRLWFMTRFAFLFAFWQRIEDWRTARAKAAAQKALDAKRAAATKPAITTKLVPKSERTEARGEPAAVAERVASREGRELVEPERQVADPYP